MDIAGWVDPDTHGWVVRPASDVEWEKLIAEYGGASPMPLRRVIEVVRAGGCRSVVVENRYIDADYKSEFAAFWVHRFASRSSFARRLHFFSSDVTDAVLHRLPADSGYLGYAVIRPIESGSLGRTMVAPPPATDGAMLTLVEDEVSLFGTRLTIRAAPLCQQDTEFLRCAH